MVTIQTAVVADFFKISAGAVTAALALGRLSNGAAASSGAGSLTASAVRWPCLFPTCFNPPA